MDVTLDLVDFFAANARMAQHFHMPLQSGTNRILTAMHRWYRTEHYARRTELIRERLANAAIGADVMVGFPGESDQEHASTLAFIENLPFTYLHVFSFSKRPGTAAAAMSREVPPRVIKSRARELRSLGEMKSAAFCREQVGRQLRVLTLRSRDDGAQHDLAGASAREDSATAELGQTPALSSNFLRVHVSGTWPANRWLNVRVLSEAGNYLTGEPEVAVNSEALAKVCR
jgi:threonylcarbamoyladenosine tRNA methylthiotransferase MtaB